MRFLTILTIIALLASCAENPNMKDSFNEALKLSQKQDGEEWQKIIDLLAPSIPYADKAPNILALSAIAHSNIRENATAREYMQRAIKADPENTDYVFFLGKIEYLDGDYQQAIIQFRDVLSRKKDEEAMIRLLYCQYKIAASTEDFINNSRELQSAIKGRKSAEAYNLAMLKAAILNEAQRNVHISFNLARKLPAKEPVLILNYAIINDTFYNRPQTALKYYTDYLELTDSQSGDQDMIKRVQERITELQSGL